MKSRYIFLSTIFTIFVIGFFVLFSPTVLYADTTSTVVTIGAEVDGCGDGNIDGGESCDGADLNGHTCITEGFVSGSISCTVTCTLDTSSCSGSAPSGGGGCSGDCTKPVVSGVVPTPANTTAQITWNATDNVAVTSCSVELLTGGAYVLQPGVTALGGDAYDIGLTGLTRDTTYTYRVYCADAAGNSSDYYHDSFRTTNVTDTVGPLITLDSTTPTLTDCTIFWSATDSSAVDSCSITYSTDLSYGDSGVVTDSYYSILSPLTPSTLYNFQISCADSLGNISSVTDTCTTLSDVTPPPAVPTLTAVGDDAAVILNWSYTDTLSDFDHYYIRYSTTACPAAPTSGDGELTSLYTISQHNTIHAPVTNFVEYYYSIFVYDTSGNISSPVCDSAIPKKQNEIGLCADGVDNDLDGDIDCADSDCAGDAACVPDAEICTDGIDNDGDGDVDCADSDCSGHTSCISPPIDPPPPGGGGTEICIDGIDNDGDDLIDCADLVDCMDHIACLITPPPACDDGIDNDGDGFIDLIDPGCDSPEDTDEYHTLDDVLPVGWYNPTISFLLAERTVLATVRSDASFDALVGDQLTIRFVPDIDAPAIDTLFMYLSGSRYALSAAADGWWYADVVVPPVGNYELLVETTYDTGEITVDSFIFHALPYGQVTSEEGPVDEASVVLYAADESIWPGTSFRQTNPQVTLASGGYGYVVPNGTYTVVVSKDGYRTRESSPISVHNNIVNTPYELLVLPETPLETAGFFGEVALEEVGDVIASLQEAIDLPEVESAAQVVAPTVVGIAVAAIVSSLWSILFPLLRFLFLQPLLVFGAVRRKKFGIIYNSLSKEPIDLAIVRLIDATTNKISQSRVTNKEGQYVFLTDPGTYRLEISKPGFVFPSILLKNKKHDGNLTDIYHGEDIVVTEDDAEITPNVPLDPEDKKIKTPIRLYMQELWKFTQHVFALLGIIITVLSLYIAPVWYLWVFLAIHIILYILFWRYARPKKAKGWGIVYSEKNKKPVGRVVARLFSKEYNKLVATELTDSKGRYAFLAAPNDYYITFEKTGFQSKQQDVKIEQDDIISENIGLIPEDKK